MVILETDWHGFFTSSQTLRTVQFPITPWGGLFPGWEKEGSGCWRAGSRSLSSLRVRISLWDWSLEDFLSLNPHVYSTYFSGQQPSRLQSRVTESRDPPQTHEGLHFHHLLCRCFVDVVWKRQLMTCLFQDVDLDHNLLYLKVRCNQQVPACAVTLSLILHVTSLLNFYSSHLSVVVIPSSLPPPLQFAYTV